MSIGRIAWLVTALACLIAGLALLLSLTSAAINLV